MRNHPKIFGSAVVLGSAISLMSPAQAATTVVVVSGKDNPFLAGRPDGFACCSGDSAPAHSPALALTGFDSTQPITFSAVGGFSHTGGTPLSTPDGGGSFPMGSFPITGIAGVDGVQLNGLIGVFLPDSVNPGAPPPRRNDGMSFLTLAPELFQIFWIGDGLTGTGTGAVQQFFAPVGATRLFLGSVDGFGWYNNSGTVTATITYTPASQAAIPEPATWLLLISGFGLVGATARRRVVRAA